MMIELGEKYTNANVCENDQVHYFIITKSYTDTCTNAKTSANANEWMYCYATVVKKQAKLEQ